MFGINTKSVAANQIVITIDTTGSMSPISALLRQRAERLVNDLFDSVVDIEIGFIFHGDYCDAGSTYVTKSFPLTRDRAALCRFIRTVSATGGGDAAECYELVLHEARTMGWNATAKKVLVLFGDDVPHSATERQNTKKLDWKNELELLLTLGVQVYAVQCLNRRHATSFYLELARRTNGFHLSFNNFAEIEELLMVIFHFQMGNDPVFRYEEQRQSSGRWSRGLEQVVNIFTGRVRSSFAAVHASSVEAGRFMWLDVPCDRAIREFVQDNDLIFQTGRGFYELTKAETVQERKEVILMDIATGDMFSGERARDMIGLPYGVRGRVHPSDVPRGYVAFVQSTSYNRKLIRGTRFLYEVDRSR